MAGFTFNFCVEEDTPGDHAGSCSNYKKEERAEMLDKESSGEHSSSDILNSTNLQSDQGGIEKVRASKDHPALPFHRELLDHVIPSTYQLSSSHQLQILYVNANNIETQCHAIKGTTDAKNGPQSPSDSANHRSGLLPLLELSNSCHSDLIPGVYEGGLKVWECALDLVEYLAESDIDFSGMRVLELGCGAGLPAIFALIRGAREVHFALPTRSGLHCR